MNSGICSGKAAAVQLQSNYEITYVILIESNKKKLKMILANADNHNIGLIIGTSMMY